MNLVVEGKADEYVMLALFRHFNLPEPLIRTNRPYRVGGKKDDIVATLRKWNEAAKWDYWAIIIDMDHDSDCVAEYKKSLLPNPSEKMIFRIAIRKIESWILADAQAVATYLGIKQSLVPTHPETLDDPKLSLLGLVHKSRRKDIKEDMLSQVGLKQGMRYPERIKELLQYWRPQIAQQSADSLKRCIHALTTISNP
jgi:hypothetical protein